MKSTLAVLLASTAVIGVLGLPALGAMQGAADAPGPCGSGLCAAQDGTDKTDGLLLRARSENDRARPLRHARDDCDDDGSDESDSDDDAGSDDDDGCIGAGRNPAPAGAVAPPDNGLFGNGAPPRAVTN